MASSITRRGFFLVSLLFGLTARAQLSIAPFFERLTTRERRTLLAVARTIFPHEHVDDEAYTRALDVIAARCAADDELLPIVKSGVAELEGMSAGRFDRVALSGRVDLLVELESSRFYRVVYQATLQGLYGSEYVWSIFVGASRTATLANADSENSLIGLRQ